MPPPEGTVHVDNMDEIAGWIPDISNIEAKLNRIIELLEAIKRNIK